MKSSLLICDKLCHLFTLVGTIGVDSGKNHWAPTHIKRTHGYLSYVSFFDQFVTNRNWNLKLGQTRIHAEKPTKWTVNEYALVNEEAENITQIARPVTELCSYSLYYIRILFV
jgi:hypothetical protein